MLRRIQVPNVMLNLYWFPAIGERCFRKSSFGNAGPKDMKVQGNKNKTMLSWREELRLPKSPSCTGT